MVPDVVALMEETMNMFSEAEKAQLAHLLDKFRRELRQRALQAGQTASL